MPGLFLNPVYRDQLGISYEVEDVLAGTERIEGFKGNWHNGECAQWPEASPNLLLPYGLW